MDYASQLIDRLCRAPGGTAAADGDADDASNTMAAAERRRQRNNYATLLESFYALVERDPDGRWLTQPMGGGDDHDGDDVRHWTFKEAFDEAKRMAAYLTSLELPRNSQVAVCSKNCAWWILADLAVWMSGHVTVPVYPTLTGGTVRYILEHSESKLLFVGKLDEHPWKEMKSGVPTNMPTVTFPLSPAGNLMDGVGAGNTTWNDAVKKFDPIVEPKLRKPDEMATIVYTSGSTGQPKGVMHDFETMLKTTVGIESILHPTRRDRYLSYLPLAHGMERWTGECISLHVGNQIFFAESVATFVEDLNRCRPTLFLSVPRLWTKFQQGVHAKMPPEKLNLLLRIPLINLLVKKKILQGLGLDQVRIAGSGSAPIPKELIEWYHSLGLELLEGYGMTENWNYSTLSRPGKTRPGYVGSAYSECEIRISDDGEVQVKGPGTMMGYFKQPDATEEAITEDGYLRTGDRGELDELGRLKITGRTKELFKTSKGKYVAPAPIENRLINHPRIEMACVGGSSYPQPHAVVKLSEASRKEAESDKGREAITLELVEHVKSVNATLDQHENIDFIAIVKDEWLPENGFLTPTQKIVRRKIEEEYDPNNDKWYSAQTKVIWYGW